MQPHANMYWWKRVVPPVEFGAMHAILLQMALLPLTMSRHLIAVLSDTFLAKVFPFQRVVAMHIHLGYTMITIVSGATILFFVFFGQLCQQQHTGKEPKPGGVMTWCKKMNSEIMATGLAILGLLLLVGFTSFFRNRIPYEVFYYVHHLVFAMFAISIAHTVDNVERTTGGRSQVFKWIVASLGIYLSDRFFMGSQQAHMRVHEWRALGDDDSDDKVLILRLHKPITWSFRPGQYARLRVASIDYTWHPFSIASAPCEETLDFYVEVAGGAKSWTGRLWAAAKENPELDSEAPFVVSVLGAYGAGIEYAGRTHSRAHIACCI
jgi:predicted ferric reductase